MQRRFTRDEVVRILGVTRRQLDYWARLRLISPELRWGERFYNFADLVALETMKRLTSRGLPARRLRRALEALREQLGEANAPISRLRITTNGRKVVVSQPWPGAPSIEPLTGQLLLEFDVEPLATKVRALPSHTAEEWFEMGLSCDRHSSTMQRAADAYRHAVELAPDWAEAHLNLGTSLFHLGEAAEARRCFEAAIELEPQNALAHFNLGCAFEKMGNHRAAIEQLERAVKLAPTLADAHLNLAMLYEAADEKTKMREHLGEYLHYEPNGRWANYAQSRMPEAPGTPASSRSHLRTKVTPFRKRG
ncbi:MAG TPA: tetratricopeptide repeat protein [Candidatus Acidoferrum sp.]|nr:tetratricopeptide repeat protein [Candidatus Acidoferrum sp.]